MWDNPRALNLAANVLIAMALVITLGIAARQLVESHAYPLRDIRVEGDLDHVTRDQVVSTLQGRVAGTFFSVDLNTLRGLFETIPWVRHAEIRRVWPDRLIVRLEEHVVLARWGQPEDGRLVNVQGEGFNARTTTDLPVFAGPAGAEGEVTRRYAQFREALAPLGLRPLAVTLSARQSWQLRLSNGLSIQLGRDMEKDRIADRLARFVSAYPLTLGSLNRRLDAVDLRYSNGFALRVPGIGDATTPTRPAGNPPVLPPKRNQA